MKHTEESAEMMKVHASKKMARHDTAMRQPFGGKQAPPFQKGKAHPSRQKNRAKIAAIRAGAK